MKKSRKSHAPHTQVPRPLDEPALTTTTGGGGGGGRPPAPAWTPEQHNEAFVRARPRSRSRSRA